MQRLYSHRVERYFFCLLAHHETNLTDLQNKISGKLDFWETRTERHLKDAFRRRVGILFVELEVRFNPDILREIKTKKILGSTRIFASPRTSLKLNWFLTKNSTCLIRRISAWLELLKRLAAKFGTLLFSSTVSFSDPARPIFAETCCLTTRAVFSYQYLVRTPRTRLTRITGGSTAQ